MATDATGRIGLSFELFPPKTSAGDETLMVHVEALMAHRPDFVTCTYGAGGSTRHKTLEVIERVKQRFGIPVASHLTCVGSTREALRDYLQEAAARGVDYIVALRGDPPKGETQFQQTAGGLRYANELVAMIREEFAQFGIAVAGYPEVHQEATSAEVDLENLKRKVDCGADIIITQLFYDNEDFFRFRDRCRAAGIAVPVIPGLLPVTNLGQVQRIATLCKAKLPATLVDRLAERDDAEWQQQVGVDHAIAQCRDLVRHGAEGLHFYVLNKSQATMSVLEALHG
jgi:methylenetetrahydrofolate reductase (NADPH)